MKPEDIENNAFHLRVIRYQEKTITDSELEQLNQELRDSEQKRREFSKICETSRLIREASIAHPEESQGRISRLLLYPVSSNWLKAGIAAMLMLGVGVFSYYANQQWKVGESGGNMADTINWGDSVVVVEEVADGAKFSGLNQAQAGDFLGKGWLRVQEGWVRLKFRSGAVVTLEAPASFGINSAMRSYLEYGKVNVYAPESARDFVVATKAMEVVDLGTRFEMNVDYDSAETMVEVTEGLVDLHLGSRGAQRKIQPLEAGWKAAVDGAGSIIHMTERAADSSPEHAKLLAHWKLDKLGEQGLVRDSGPMKLDGVFQMNSEGLITDGKVGQALDMGDEGYVDISQHIESITGGDGFSISAWVRDPSDKVGIIFSISDGSVNNRIQFNLNNKNLVYLWQDGSSRWDSIAGAVDGWKPGVWYHVVVTVDHSGVKLYRDAKLLASGSTGIQIGTASLGLADITNPTEMFLGLIRQGMGGVRVKPQWFGGSMDDVQLYANALSHSAVSALYQNPGLVLPEATE